VNKKEIEFLKESNAIEKEYSDLALEDAIEAWKNTRNIPNLDLGYILITHLHLMKRLNPRIAGQFRNYNVRIGNCEGLDHKKIVDALISWCKLPFKTEEHIKILHAEFEKIHPFEDGNGRTGRILMNWQRLKIGLPVLVIREKEKFDYYKWFR